MNDAAVNHVACIDAHSPGIPLPDAEYQVGDYVTCGHGSFKITGRPHREWYGAKGATCKVSWPAEKIDPSAIPPALTRAHD